ncbi:MAG: TetR/AcrR family transcriptional regulator [Novosphingobium sp.]|jgi:AcrR family transcriptional regulator|nr:TetR/AcrR family transcriptional regulator [Novosphingobium sp.]
MASQAEHVSQPDPPDDTPGQRKRRIIAAANELLEEEGLEGLTIRAVLRRSGLARRAFYERFAGKDDLVVAVFAETLAEAAAFFEEQMAALPDPVNRLAFIIANLVLGGIRNEGRIGVRRASAIVREHMRLAESRPAELESALRPLLAVIAEQISEGIRTGQLRNCDPVLQATLIYNLIATTVHPEWLMEGEGLASGRGQWLADEIWEFCRRAIAA